MLILVALISTIIALISPVGGLIFLIVFGYRFYNRRFVFFASFSGFAVCLKILNLVETVSIADVIIGVGITSYLYFENFFKGFDYTKNILTLILMNIVYAVARLLLFKNMIAANLQYLFEQYQAQIGFNPADKDDIFFLEIFEKMKFFLLNYQIAIWIISITVALYLSSLILSKRTPVKWIHKKIRFPFYLIYLLIPGLVLMLIPETSLIGKNAILILFPIFLIQGISILHFYWGDFFKKSKILLFLLIFSMLINFYMLILVMLIGLADIWFNFRKIKMNAV